MDPKWPVLGDDEMVKLGGYRELLRGELGIDECTEDETDNGAKVKPADNAISIALRSDRAALSKKKFRKQLKKSVFENFSERFGVSEETEEQLGKLYLDMEKAEADAVAAYMEAVRAIYSEKKTVLSEELKGYGKEARKLYRQYKDVSHAQMDSFEADVSGSYDLFEEELRKCMVEYELAVGTQGVTPEDAMNEYSAKITVAYDAHRAEIEAARDAVKAKLAEIADEYYEIGKAFRKTEDIPAKENAAVENAPESETDAAEEPQNDGTEAAETAESDEAAD